MTDAASDLSEDVSLAPRAQAPKPGPWRIADIVDGRKLRITLVDADGRILAEGHGPSRCLCC